MGRPGCSPRTLPKRCLPSLTRPPWTRPTLRRSRTALAPVSPHATVDPACGYHVKLGYNTWFLWCAFKGKGSPGSESDGGDSRSELGSGEIQPKKVMIHSALPRFIASCDFPFFTFPSSFYVISTHVPHLLAMLGLSSKALFLAAFFSMSKKLFDEQKAVSPKMFAFPEDDFPPRFSEHFF